MSDWLPVAVRAYGLPPADLLGESSKERHPRRRTPQPTHVLVFDTETTTDPTQALTFGSWRLFDVVDEGQLACVQEGLLHADDLAETNPNGLAVLQEYQRHHRAEIDMRRPQANWELMLLSRKEFVDRILYKAAYEKPRATVVAFNFPFDITRVAVRSARANFWTKTSKKDPTKKRRLSSFAGGFSVQLWDYEGKEHAWRPRIGLKTIDSKRALKGFRSPSEIDEEDKVEGKVFNGHFLDARTLVFALTNEGHTLESATRAFGVPYSKRPVTHGQITEEYVTYCREDVEATAQLYEAAMAEYRRHPIRLQATKAYSPASIAKSYLEAMGVAPVLDRQADFDPHVLGWATSAFYGGRAECRIRNVPVPVDLVDFTSMYPTVDALMDLWSVLTCAKITVDDEVAPVQELLDRVDLDGCFDPRLWPSLVGIAQIQPDGDLLPCRARYGDGPGWNIGINPLTSRFPMWFTLADLVAAKVLTGKTPQVLQARRFIPSGGHRKGLRSTRLRGAVAVDPREADFFTSVVEERQRLKRKTDGHEADCACEDCRNDQFLKVLANSGSYGIYAEMVRHELGSKDTVPVEVYSEKSEAFTSPTGAPETPGTYCFPPLAASITGAARLMLALVEGLVTQAGGAWAMCDTDSMAIVSNERGGLVPCPGGPHRLPDGTEAIRALSAEEVRAIRHRFGRLNPYSKDAIPDDKVLKSEVRTRCFAISAKRYALYDVVDGEVVLSPMKVPSQHGLGHLADPTRNDLTDDEPEGEDGEDGDVLEAKPVERRWISEAWHWIVSEAEELSVPKPDWLSRMAVSRLAISSPLQLRAFDDLNTDRAYADKVKPYNFMLAAHVADNGHPLDVDPTKFRLVAPFERNSSKWKALPWRNLYDPGAGTYSVTTRRSRGERGESDEVRVKSMHPVMVDYRNHPEVKSLGPEGGVCGDHTRGLLARRAVAVSALHHIGKEANELEDVQAGIEGDIDRVLIEYVDPADDPLRTLVLPVLAGLSNRRVGILVGADHKTIGAIRRGSRPRKGTSEKLWKLALEVADASAPEVRSPAAHALIAEDKDRSSLR